MGREPVCRSVLCTAQLCKEVCGFLLYEKRRRKRILPTVPPLAARIPSWSSRPVRVRRDCGRLRLPMPRLTSMRKSDIVKKDVCLPEKSGKRRLHPENGPVPSSDRRGGSFAGTAGIPASGFSREHRLSFAKIRKERKLSLRREPGLFQ